MVGSKDSVTNSESFIGCRVEYNGFYGIIRFVGPVENTTGSWLGIDWDDPSRGKHDGTHNGIKYFSCRNATSGSFVRKEKVNFGRSFVDAVKARYGDAQKTGIDTQSLAALQKEMNARFLEVIGFDKIYKAQSQFSLLKSIWLREHMVNGPGCTDDIIGLCPNVEELDLSKNLINSWELVANITCHLHLLETLNVSDNNLTLPEVPHLLTSSFENLKLIVMGKLGYTWEDVIHCFIMWPCLQQLQVPFNNITLLDYPSGNLKQLISLDLEGNQICDWTEILKLGSLQHLESLNVTNVGISSVWFPCSSDEKTSLFPSLKLLNLAENKIDDWKSLAELNKLQSLEELRFRCNPITEKNSYDVCFLMIVASVCNLKNLNKQPITPEEKRGAEYDYLKRFGQQWLKLNKDGKSESGVEMQNFLDDHPRYKALVKKYGALEEDEIKSQSYTIKTQVITIEIFSPESPKSFLKKLPLNMSVQRLIGLVQRLFDTGSAIPSLSYISAKMPHVEIPLDNNLKLLGFYSIENGDRISVRW